jgi:hypothetical protein
VTTGPPDTIPLPVLSECTPMTVPTVATPSGTGLLLPRVSRAETSPSADGEKENAKNSSENRAELARLSRGQQWMDPR